MEWSLNSKWISEFENPYVLHACLTKLKTQRSTGIIDKGLKWNSLKYNN